MSGETFRHFTTERIFGPLGMKSTHFRDDFDEIVKNMAYGYEPAGGTFRLSVTNYDTVGATSLLTTVEDLALWDENFYTPRVGGQGLVEQLLERGKLNDGTQIDYAAGLEHGTYRGLNVVDHGGADAGYRSDMIRFPDQHFSVACLCNLSAGDPGGLAREVADVYLGALMQPAAAHADDAPGIRLTPAQRQAKAGVYVNVKDPTDVVRFVVKDGGLQTGNAGDEETYPVQAISENRFRLAIASDEITFLPGRAGAPVQLSIQHDDGKVETFAAAPAFAPTAAELGEYAGTYSSREIDPLYTIQFGHLHVSGAGPEHEHDGLVLMRLKNDPDPLRPVTRDFFAADVGKIRFTRDASGKVDGFLLTTGRVIDLKFERGRAGIAR